MLKYTVVSLHGTLNEIKKLLSHGNDKRLKLDSVCFKPMRSIIIAGFVIALASGLFLNYAGHPWQVFAQANNAQNASQSSTGASNASKSSGAGGNATSQSQGGGGAAGGGGNATTTPSSTVSTVKGGPKAAGSASQLQQLAGPNASKILSSNTPVGNKPGLQGLGAESTTTSQKNATSAAGAPSGGQKPSAGASSAGQNASSAAGSAANKTSAGASSAANKTSAGASSAGQNASSAAGSAANKTSAGAQNATGGGQGQNNTNPLAKIPLIGKLFGG